MISSLDTIREQVTSCTKCDLCKTRKNAVPGKGIYSAEVVFVGEAPGRSEDRLGQPFVGAAGKRLDEALEEAGFSRDTVYITNVVKCRPPNNRVPNKTEKDSCRQYLEQELAIINPKIICVLGNTAFNSLLGGAEITKNRGSIIKHQGRQYFITIHPAATIYNQELVSVLKDDIKKLHKILQE